MLAFAPLELIGCSIHLLPSFSTFSWFIDDQYFSPFFQDQVEHLQMHLQILFPMACNRVSAAGNRSHLDPHPPIMTKSNILPKLCSLIQGTGRFEFRVASCTRRGFYIETLNHYQELRALHHFCFSPRNDFVFNHYGCGNYSIESERIYSSMLYF